MRTVLALVIILATAPAAELPGWLAALQPPTDAWRRTAQDLVFNNGSEPQTLDPHRMTGVPEHRLALALFEGLVTQHPGTLEPLPGVADGWEVTADGLTWTFHLASDATWSDGTRITAADFVASWRRLLTPATGAEYAYLLYHLVGAEDFHRGRHTDFARVGVQAVDAETLRVNLAHPCAYFLDLAAFATLVPVPVAAIEQHGESWTRPEHIVTNGPFVLGEWRPRERILLRRNPHYRFAAAVELATVTALPYDDLDTGLKLFRAGQLHWQPAVPVAQVSQLQLDPDYYSHPYLGTYFYRFNCTRPPFDDPAVRRALSLAIDRRQITEDILKAGQTPAGHLTPPGCGGFTAAAAAGEHGYDLVTARQLWAGTPYGRGERPWPTVELLFNNSESHRVIAENIVQQWQQKLGVKVTLRNAEWQVYLEAMNALDYQVMRSSWIGDYNDPTTFLDLFVSDGGNNRTGWSDARYDALLRQTVTETDRQRRLDLFRELDRLLVQEGCPIMPIYFYVNQGLLSERVQGWRPNLRDQHPFQHLWLE